MSEPAPETPKRAKRSTNKTEPTATVEAEVIEETTPASQPTPTESQPASTPTPTPLVIRNRPSAWIAIIGVALLVFLFGYVTGLAMSNGHLRPMQRPGMWQQHDMRGSQMPRGNNQEQNDTSNVPSV